MDKKHKKCTPYYLQSNDYGVSANNLLQKQKNPRSMLECLNAFYTKQSLKYKNLNKSLSKHGLIMSWKGIKTLIYKENYLIHSLKLDFL